MAVRSRRGRLVCLAVGAALAWAASADAQVPDSTRRAIVLQADSAAVTLLQASGGRVLTGTPAVTAALSPENLLAGRPGAFLYSLGSPGLSAGLSFDGLAPWSTALTLDERPMTDLLTGVPRFDLLPLEILAPLRETDTRFGAPLSIAASARRFRLGVPVTELRFVAGQLAVQHVSGTHAQTRRPPPFLRGGSDLSRLTGSFHVASRSAGASAPKHTHLLTRLLLTRPDLALELGNHYADRTERASSTPVLRRTLRNALWLRAARPVFGAAPLDATVSWTTQRSIATAAALDTVRVHAAQLALALRQPVSLRGHAIALHVDASRSPSPSRGAAALGMPGARTELSATARDTLAFGAARLSLEGGATARSAGVAPVAAVRADAGPLFVGVRLSTPPTGLALSNGLLGRVAATPGDSQESVLLGEMGGKLAFGAFDAEARIVGHQRTNALLLVEQGANAFAVVQAGGPLRFVGASLRSAWRRDAERGLYATTILNTGGLLNAADSDMHGRQDLALPRVHGYGRLGARAVATGQQRIAIDVALTLRGWTPFRGVRLEPTTGLTALRDPSVGADLPGRVQAGFDLRAAFGTSATLLLRYEPVPIGYWSEFPSVVTDEPMPRALTFGVFWGLLN